MAHTRGVRPKTTDTLHPRLISFHDDLVEVARMGTVDHEVGGVARGGVVNLHYCVSQGLARREPPVGLDCEGEDHGHVHLLGGSRYADCLFSVVHGDGGHQVGRGACERLDLHAMVVLGFLVGHSVVHYISVAARTDTPADDDWCSGGFVVASDLLYQANGLRVRFCQTVFGIAEFLAPVRVGPPRGGLENETDIEPVG